MEGITIDEIAGTLGITPKTAHKRLERAGLKPISYKALYNPSVINAISTPSRGGRPKNQPPPEPLKSSGNLQPVKAT
jgi:hypothetical protein